MRALLHVVASCQVARPACPARDLAAESALARVLPSSGSVPWVGVVRARQLVISDSHRGLTNAVATVLQGAAWQRCRVHFMRDALAKVNKGHAEMLAATIWGVFAQPTPDTIREQVDEVANTLAGRLPAVAELLREAKADPTAFADFPQAHWLKICRPTRSSGSTVRSTGRTDIVGIFSKTEALLRLAA